ncbi:hypothetical protein WME75_16935 [Sorangium sp. So ce1014]|uniref:hypothetical protein n=1 Tax=Sorangium sp. So ce1014 TaxID=3133326 RepID=UPI003F62B20C
MLPASRGADRIHAARLRSLTVAARTPATTGAGCASIEVTVCGDGAGAPDGAARGAAGRDDGLGDGSTLGIHAAATGGVKPPSRAVRAAVRSWL